MNGITYIQNPWNMSPIHINVSVTGAPQSNMMNKNNVVHPHKQLMKLITNSPRSSWLFVT